MTTIEIVLSVLGVFTAIFMAILTVIGYNIAETYRTADKQEEKCQRHKLEYMQKLMEVDNRHLEANKGLLEQGEKDQKLVWQKVNGLAEKMTEQIKYNTILVTLQTEISEMRKEMKQILAGMK